MGRTKLQRKIAKNKLNKSPGPFEQVDLSSRPHPEWMTRAYQNNRYVVMVNDNAVLFGSVPVVKVAIQKHDDTPLERHWREIQSIKNVLFGPETMAIEFYPRQSELFDVANVYWIWILPDDVVAMLSSGNLLKNRMTNEKPWINPTDEQKRRLNEQRLQALASIKQTVATVIALPSREDRRRFMAAYRDKWGAVCGNALEAMVRKACDGRK